LIFVVTLKKELLDENYFEKEGNLYLSDTPLYRLNTQGSVKRKAEGGEETVRLPSPAFRLAIF